MKITLLLSVLALVFFSNGQTFQITDQYVFGGYESELPADVIRANQSIIISGSSGSGISESKTSINYGDADLWILSLDGNKNIEWQVGYGGDMEDGMSSLLHTSDDHILVLASSESNVSGNKTTSSNGAMDLWLIKMDLQGNEIWQKNYGGSGIEYAQEILEKSDGTYMLLATSDSPISGDKSENTKGLNDYWILNIDSNGNVLWDKTIGGSNYDYAVDFTLDEAENLIVVGNSTSPISYDKTEDNFSQWDDFWIVKLDQNGSVIWDRTIGGDSFDVCTKIVYSNNIIFVLGYSGSGISGLKSDTLRGASDYWVTKLDGYGNFLLDKTFGGNKDDVIDDAIITSTGELILTGTTRSDVSGEVEIPTYNNSLDFWSLVIDTTDLSLKHQFMIGGFDNELRPKIIETENNSFLLLGGSDSGIGGDKTTSNFGQYDFWLLELSTDLSTTNFQKEETLSIYPNPTSNTFEISNLPIGEGYDLNVIDMMGKSVLRSNISSLNNSVDVNSLNAGMYTLRMFDGKKSYTSKLIVE